MQTIQEKLEAATDGYFDIKASCESNVSRWEWTTHNYYELEPYYPKWAKKKKQTAITRLNNKAQGVM